MRNALHDATEQRRDQQQRGNGSPPFGQAPSHMRYTTWVWLLCRDCLTWEVGNLAGWVAALPRGCRGGMQRWAPAEATGGGGTRGHGCGWDGRSGQERPDTVLRTITATMPVSAILSLNGELIVANAALAAGDAIPSAGSVTAG